MQEVNIKTKLIYFYGDMYASFCDYAVKAMKFHFKGREEEANMPDLLMYLMRKHGLKEIKTTHREPKTKHKKTTLFYFSERAHLAYTNYMNKYVFKGLNGKQKKLAQTEAILWLLITYLKDNNIWRETKQ